MFSSSAVRYQDFEAGVSPATGKEMLPVEVNNLFADAKAEARVNQAALEGLKAVEKFWEISYQSGFGQGEDLSALYSTREKLLTSNLLAGFMKGKDYLARLNVKTADELKLLHSVLALSSKHLQERASSKKSAFRSRDPNVGIYMQLEPFMKQTFESKLKGNQDAAARIGALEIQEALENVLNTALAAGAFTKEAQDEAVREGKLSTQEALENVLTEALEAGQLKPNPESLDV